MLNVYAILDKKSGVLSNHFVSGDPFEKVKEVISINLLQFYMRDKTHPYVLFGSDYELINVGVVPDELSSDLDLQNCEHVNIGQLLAASRHAYDFATDQTSPSDEPDNVEE